MKANLTDITVIFDRSGSMQACRDDAEGGLNAFIETQKKQPGDCLLTLVDFNTHYRFLHKAKPIADVPSYELVPYGGTALYDAVGRAINETGARLAAMPEDDRPGLVICVIVTDGQENSSVEFKRDQIKAMITEQQEKYSWQFVFLAANQDAFEAGGSVGIGPQGVAGYKEELTSSALAGASNNVTRMRASYMKGESVVNGFTEQERKDMA